MNGLNLQKQPVQLLGKTDGCPWCDAGNHDPITTHHAWCERRIMFNIRNRGKDKRAKHNTTSGLEKMIEGLKSQLLEYEETLVLIAAPVRPDGTYNRSREACGKLAANILKAHKVKV
jgi:hypothetical protein